MKHKRKPPTKDFLFAAAKITVSVLIVLFAATAPNIGWLLLILLLAPAIGVYWARRGASLQVTIAALAAVAGVGALLWLVTNYKNPVPGMTFIALVILVPGIVGLLVPQKSLTR